MDGATAEKARDAAADVARKRAAVELVSRYERTLRRTARRYSLCADDADDAYQRMLEILLTKAPTDRGRELIAWAQTVTKHEALAVRRQRERLLGSPPPGGRDGEPALDLIALIPARGDGPETRAERREAIARSREALQALKPAELRALTLLAEGYSYAEIGELTGYSHTKVNRCLAEGRERFRSLISRSEDGSRCEEMRSLLSAFCDGEASAEQAATLREHLRACAGCRATLRAYRATPGAVAALAPVLPLWRLLLGRGHELLSSLHSRLPGQGSGAGSAAGQAVATGGAPGIGGAALAKVAVVLAGVGGAATGVATGVVPSPLDSGSDEARAPAIERVAEPASREEAANGRSESKPVPKPRHEAKPAKRHRKPEPEPTASGSEGGEVEYAPPPAPEPAPVEAAAPSGEPSSSSGGAAAGEFGP
ncbi:MAG TPA: sigma-70 family RNA polymerase sigma factor [Solirubrobacterales bacterium]|nr:sigma-70 family RNA polymerase sigma factor [Solirubrobacterales bacterium]